MSAVALLFSRKFAFLTRSLLLVTGYDTRRKEFSERLYGLYVLFIMGGVALLLLSYAVTTVAAGVAHLPLASQNLSPLFFAGLGFWLALTPWKAQRSYDLYRFSLPDLDFLSNAPLSPALIGVAWFAKSLFTRWGGIFVLACGIIASALSIAAGRSDLVGLALGACSGAAFFVVVSALLWVLGLLRYQPVPLLPRWAGYGLTLAAVGGVVLLLLAPPFRFVLWPAWLASSLITGTAGSLAAFALAGLLATAAASVFALFLVSRNVLLAPAFEEGRLGGQLRRSGGSGTSGMDDPRVQVTLARKLARGQSVAVDRPTRPDSPTGPIGALLYKQKLRLQHLSPFQAFMSISSLLGLGVAVASGLASASRLHLPFEVVGLGVLIANFSLIRFGISIVRGDLAHIDFFVGWPISRNRLLLYNALMGFGPPLVSGELALLVAAPWLPASYGTWLWLAIWPVLALVTAAVAMLELKYLLRKWPATPETLPDLGPASLAVASVVWLAAVLYAPLLL